MHASTESVRAELRLKRRPLAVVIVTYNSAKVIVDCLSSLQDGLAGTRSRLVVVDNASTDDTVALVAAARPEALVVRRPTNGGYAAGVNSGFAAAPGHDVLVLNPDIRLRDGAVHALREELDRPGVGIVVPTLIAADGHRLPSLRRRPTVLRGAGEAALGGRRAGRIGWLGATVTAPGAYSEACTVDWATGAAWLVSAECRERIGALDERYFLYSEETEYMLRAGDHGQAVRLQPEAVAVHLGGEQGTSARLWALSATNRVRLHRERCGGAAGACMWAVVMINELIRAAGVSRPRHKHVAAVRALSAMSRWPEAPAE